MNWNESILLWHTVCLFERLAEKKRWENSALKSRDWVVVRKKAWEIKKEKRKKGRGEGSERGRNEKRKERERERNFKCHSSLMDRPLCPEFTKFSPQNWTEFSSSQGAFLLSLPTHEGINKELNPASYIILLDPGVSIYWWSLVTSATSQGGDPFA